MKIAIPSIAAVLTTVLMLSGFAAAACPYPLGPFAAERHIITHNWGGLSDDLEWNIVEATWIHGQKSFGQVVNAGGQLHFLYDDEVEYELPDGSPAETQAIYYKQYSNTTGWDVPLLDLSHSDVNNPRPNARNVQPFATARGDEFWAVWEVSGDPAYRINGATVLVRGKTAGGFTPIQPVWLTPFDSANKQAKIVTVGDSLYIAWQTNAYQNDSLEYRIVGRSFNGTDFGPLEDISVPNDGWSDQVVSLATDGKRVFAAWASQDKAYQVGEGDWVIKAAVRSETGVWGSEINLTASTLSGNKGASAAFFQDRLYVAWATTDPALDLRGDYDIVMKALDPSTGAVGPLVRVSTDAFQGEELDPNLSTWPEGAGGDGMLHVLFSSTSSPQGIPTSGVDNDIYYTAYNGSAFTPIRLVSDPLDNGYVEVLPGFFAIGDELFAYFLSNTCLPGCGHETDWREMTRLLERPARWYDDLRANFSISTAWPASNATTALVHFAYSNGTPAVSDDFYGRTASGEAVRLAPTNGSASMTFSFNASSIQQVWGTYCGKDVPTLQDAVPAPALPQRPSPVEDIVLPALLAAAALGALVARRAKRA